MTADDLFLQAKAIATADEHTPGLNRQMHETLVLACHEAIKDSNQAYGNLFAQVGYLCKQYRVSVADTIAIQTMRRHSNSIEPLSREDLLYDVRALCLFISAVFSVGIPSSLHQLIPKENRPFERSPHTDFNCIRCIVESIDGDTLTVTPEQGITTEETQTLTVSIAAPHLSYVKEIVYKGAQINLIDCAVSTTPPITPHSSLITYTPSLVILEPDFLVDISPISRTFQSYGRHPLIYTIHRLAPGAITQPILLGNLAGSVLDDVIHSTGNYDVRNTIRDNFRDKAIEFCTCKDFNADAFVNEAYTQARNIQDAVSTLGHDFSLDKAILEPSFVCERLGISGRFDLLTSDFRLLVEQKSGKNFNIQTGRPGEHGSMMQEEHYVQLLLYYGILRHNFNLGFDRVSLRLLYSKYPAKSGLIVVNYLQQLFREAIRIRNLIVAWDLHIARHGFQSVIDLITPATVNERNNKSDFFIKWKLPELKAVCDTLHRLSPLEHAYFCRMLTFVYQEQRVSLLGSQEGITHSNSDLWNMPLQEKLETGSIIMGAHPQPLPKGGDECNQSNTKLSSKEYTFSITHYSLPHREGGGGSSPNFRRGDFIYLYAYIEDQEPDVRKSILHKGNITEIHTDSIAVELNEPQHLSMTDTYAIEHASTDSSTTASIRSLFQFIQADADRKSLLLGQRPPTADTSLQLSRSWHPDYDDVLLHAMQARDYFLLIGPPGTGKTSMALHFIVEEELNRGGTLLLMSYTNRAVDEICAMLQKAALPYVRIGKRSSCETAYRQHLLEEIFGSNPRLSDIRLQLQQTRIIVGTTSMMQAHPHIFSIKQFSLAVIDEASQILEPQLVGLLSRKTIDRFILIGDHKQLPAVVQQTASESRVDDPLLKAIQLDDCRHSLFERLLRTERKSGRRQFVGILRKQGRMHPDIAEFSNRMFYGGQLDVVPLPHQLEASPRGGGLEGALIFIPSEPCRQPGVTDKVNISEARIVAHLLHKVYLQHANNFDPQKTVGVIVPYRNQIAAIRQQTETLGIPVLEDITIDTVERYQGSQRDVIIYSFTAQCPWQLDFLTSTCFVEDGQIIDRKLNVALTRARCQLFITGNEPLLRQNPIFRQLIEFIKEKGGYMKLPNE
ncbi:MAG: AAA family ATPase [Prevotella sp.]|nr:AAA family ATPase [Prevotella sp.]